MAPIFLLIAPTVGEPVKRFSVGVIGMLIFLLALAAFVASAATFAAGMAQSPAARPPAFSVVEATIPDMQRAMQQHRLTSRQLVTEYLTRIALYEKRINAAMSDLFFGRATPSGYS